VSLMQRLKRQVPWWGKIGAKMILSRVPTHYALWQKLGLFRHGYMDTANYSLGVFAAHTECAGLRGKLAGKTVLELGPGDSIATALIAKAYGARAVLLDAGAYATRDLSVYKHLADSLMQKGLTLPSLDTIDSFEAFLDVCDARYLTQGLASAQTLVEQSIDFVFSQAVLEHVRRDEFLAMQRALARALRADGICSHRIDLRDHLGGALNNLRFKEATWESDFFAQSGFYTNRIQMKQMLELFGMAGFNIEVLEVRAFEELPTPRRKMAQEFAGLPEDELNVSGFDVLLRNS
jgi:hypothetical protein